MTKTRLIHLIFSLQDSLASNPLTKDSLVEFNQLEDLGYITKTPSGNLYGACAFALAKYSKDRLENILVRLVNLTLKKDGKAIQ